MAQREPTHERLTSRHTSEVNGQAESPHERLDRLILDWQFGQIVRAFLTLGLPDLLGSEARDVGWLAENSSTHAPSLRRLLTAARGLDLVASGEVEGEYVLGPVGRELTVDAASPYRELVLLCTAPWLTRPWEHLAEAIRTGTATFSTAHGTDYWSYVATHPQEAAAFNEGMAVGQTARATALASALDIAEGTTVVDVGGGSGLLLACLLQAKPGVLGILADTPEGVAGAPDVLESHGVQERVRIVASDFLQGVPGGGDLYILSRIVHDWADEPAEAILRNTRKAMRAGGRVVLIEGVLPDRADVPSEQLLDLAREDLEMLLLVGGKERTREEYAELLGRAGFELTNVHEVPGRDIICAIAR